MKMERLTTTTVAARNAVINDVTNEPRNSGFNTSRNLTFAFAALASLALAGGCCTKSKTTASYTPLPATAYTEPAPQPAPVETGTVVPLYTESVNVQKREVDAGSVRIKKIVRTETVNQPVELRHEEIVIERGSGTGETKGIAEAFKEGETVIPLRREEAVIQKQPASAGEIVVRSRWVTEPTTVKTEIRREDIDLASLSNTPHVIIGQSVGAASTPGGQSTGAATSGDIITDPASLPTANAGTFAGRSVNFKDMKCTRVVDDHAIQVSTDSGRRIYILSDDPISNVKPGDTVVVTGTVREAGSAAVSEKKGATYLMSQPYYIQAKKIEVAQ